LQGSLIFLCLTILPYSETITYPVANSKYPIYYAKLVAASLKRNKSYKL
jgi:hypothetical protein